METRANFALIGASAIAVVFFAFVFVYRVLVPSQTAQLKVYELVVRGSVSGILKGSAVQFNGLKVGEVTNLAISDEDPSRVDVFISIDKKIPVKANTRARLEQTSLTGVPVVSLAGGTPGAPDLEIKEGQRFPRIVAERSEYQNLLENIQRLTTKASDVFEKLDNLLDPTTVSAIKESVKNIGKLTETLADKGASIGGVIRDSSEFLHSLKPVVVRLDKLLGAGEQSLKTLDPALKALDPKKLKSITGDMAGATANLKSFSATGLRQYEQLAADARRAVDTLDRALRSLERDPSQVIFGPSQATPEHQGQ